MSAVSTSGAIVAVGGRGGATPDSCCRGSSTAGSGGVETTTVAAAVALVAGEALITDAPLFTDVDMIGGLHGGVGASLNMG